MPVQNNNFDRFTDTDAADRAALQAMGMACLQVAQPLCPVGRYPAGSGKTGGNLRRSHRIKVSADHVDVGVTADYGGYVHNGTSKQKAQPWLKNAAQANRDSITAFGMRAWRGAMGE